MARLADGGKPTTSIERPAVDHPLRTLNRENARQLDRRATEEFGVPSIVLMENAGRGVADTLCGLGIDGPVVICCGYGNNGGDGFVIARHLDLRGYPVRVLTWGWQQSVGRSQASPTGGELTRHAEGDAATNLAVLAAANFDIHYDPEPAELKAALNGACWVVDALLGTGARGNPRPPLDEVINTINASGVPVMAVDLPSGLDCDTGEAANPTIRARHTCTFVAIKQGLLAENARQYTGDVHICDIGAPRVLVGKVANYLRAPGELPPG